MGPDRFGKAHGEKMAFALFVQHERGVAFGTLVVERRTVWCEAGGNGGARLFTTESSLPLYGHERDWLSPEGRQGREERKEGRDLVCRAGFGSYVKTIAWLMGRGGGGGASWRVRKNRKG